MLLLWTQLIGNVCFLFFLPVALWWVFKTQIKATAYMTGKKMTVLCPCPPACVFGHDALGWPGFGYHPQWGPNLPKPHSVACTRGRNLSFGCFEECYRTNATCQSHHCWGFIPVPVKFASATTGFGEFGVFNLPSTLGLIMHSLMIRCPHHSSSNGCLFLPLSV